MGKPKYDRVQLKRGLAFLRGRMDFEKRADHVLLRAVHKDGVTIVMQLTEMPANTIELIHVVKSGFTGLVMHELVERLTMTGNNTTFTRTADKCSAEPSATVQMLGLKLNVKEADKLAGDIESTGHDAFRIPSVVDSLEPVVWIAAKAVKGQSRLREDVVKSTKDVFGRLKRLNPQQ